VIQAEVVCSLGAFNLVFAATSVHLGVFLLVVGALANMTRSAGICLPVPKLMC